MTDDLIDPRVDATATVLWKRLKDSDLATPAEQVILHNLAEIMKGQQRLTERVEKLANAVEKLANNQKLSKNRRLSNKSATSGAADNEHEDDTGFVDSEAAKALRQLMEEHQEQLSLIYDSFIDAGNKKVYQMRHSNAAADAIVFATQAIASLDQNCDVNSNDERTTSELSTLLKQLNNDTMLDLYAKLGKGRMAKIKAAKKEKAVETGATGDIDTTDGAQTTRKTRSVKRHRPNLEAVHGEVGGSSSSSKKHRKLVARKDADIDADEEDDDEEPYQEIEGEEEADEDELDDSEDDDKN
ncbi:hypothetical protein B7494_g2018 [Chlorociboria aeruginascens]|nr:hypothetical protein B7494_g2018 [Chlorociboria aeruginascens]